MLYILLVYIYKVDNMLGITHIVNTLLFEFKADLNYIFFVIFFAHITITHNVIVFIKLY